jgi:hypothetical protein
VREVGRIIGGMVTAARVVVFTVIAAVVVFAVVQDRLTAAGAREYVRLQRAAIAGAGPAVSIDAVMQPAVRRSVRQALGWSGVVMSIGVAGAAVVSRRSRRG